MRKVLHEDLIYEILAAVGEIPRGKVASYGQIARLIGRVVNHAGRPAPNWPEQQHLLEREGIQFKPNGCVDMKRFRWEC